MGMFNPLGGDAGRYAAISKVMVKTGDWLNLSLHGQPYLQKPPLLMWLSALGVKWFGATNFAVRVFPVIYSLLMFVAVLSAVGYTLVVKRLAVDYTPITMTAYQSLYGLILFIPLFLIFEVPHLDLNRVTTPSLLAVIYLGVFGSGICFIFMAIGIRELGASKANIFANLIPVVTAILSFLLLKEAMPLLKILGIFIVIVGLLMSQVSSLRVHRSSRKDPFRHIPNP
jgi:drug/metabolite transporter (DMT)-like permease